MHETESQLSAGKEPGLSVIQAKSSSKLIPTMATVLKKLLKRTDKSRLLQRSKLPSVTHGLSNSGRQVLTTKPIIDIQKPPSSAVVFYRHLRMHARFFKRGFEDNAFALNNLEFKWARRLTPESSRVPPLASVPETSAAIVAASRSSVDHLISVFVWQGSLFAKNGLR